MRTASPRNNEIWKPTRDELEALTVGDMALDCFGHWHTVTEIFYRTTDIQGRYCVGYYTDLGDRAAISHSAREDEIVSTLGLVSEFCTMDKVEDWLNRKGREEANHANL